MFKLHVLSSTKDGTLKYQLLYIIYSSFNSLYMFIHFIMSLVNEFIKKFMQDRK